MSSQAGGVSFSQRRKFTGQEYDADTGLSYMNARYQTGMMGRFISQDPVFWAVGDNRQIKQLTGSQLPRVLADPQGLNSYAYARNNPLRLVDPNGQWFLDVMTGRQSWNSFSVEVGDAANYLYDNSGTWKTAMDHPIAAGAVVGVGSGALAYGAVAGLTALSTSYLGGAGTACLASCGQASQQVSRAVDYVGNYGSQLGSKMNQISQDLNKTNSNPFDDHAVLRMAQRNVDVSTVNNIMNNIKPFNYFHDGIMKNGYYDSATKVFIGQEQPTGLIKTIINNVGQNYINNLKATIK